MLWPNTLIQNANEVKKVKVKSMIENLHEALQNAKQEQKETQEECKKLEPNVPSDFLIPSLCPFG